MLYIYQVASSILILIDAGKEGRPYLHILLLSEFVGDKSSATKIKGIDFIKDARIEVTRGLLILNILITKMNSTKYIMLVRYSWK